MVAVGAFGEQDFVHQDGARLELDLDKTEYAAGDKAVVQVRAPFPGKILAIDMAELGGELLCQKDGFLAAAYGTKLSIAFNQRLGAGFFGGEGFILQRMNGDGMVFVHAGGTVIRKELSNSRLRIDTGCVVAFTPGIDFDIERAGNLKSMLFGGEGLFLATLQGTGSVWIQSMPFSRLADRVLAHAPAAGGARTEEGSILGGLGGLIDGIRELTRGQDRPPTLILAGDILDLALSLDEVCAMVFRLFAHLAFGDGPPAFDPVIHYVPGNHDHHEWEITRENQYVTYVCGQPGDAELAAPWHTTKLVPVADHPVASSTLLNRYLVQRVDSQLRATANGVLLSGGDVPNQSTSPVGTYPTTCSGAMSPW